MWRPAATGGLDSLYVSYAGVLRPHWVELLRERKRMAQSRDALERSAAQVDICGDLFSIGASGRRRFDYVLRGDYLDLSVSGEDAGAMPLVWVQVSSEALSQSHVPEILSRLAELVENLGGDPASARVSRADICVDLVPIRPLGFITKRHWVGRARKKHEYSEDDVTTGWAIGLGGGIGARLYNKSIEIRQVSAKEFFYDLWAATGWDRESDVWRLEFEVWREVLGELGIRSPDELLERMADLFGYCTNWLSLRVPSETDTNRTRWPLDPLWAAVKRFDWSKAGPVRPLSRLKQAQAPSLASIYKRFASALTTFIAVSGATERSLSVSELVAGTVNYYDDKAGAPGSGFRRYVEDQVRAKVRRYNLRRNPWPVEP